MLKTNSVTNTLAYRKKYCLQQKKLYNTDPAWNSSQTTNCLHTSRWSIPSRLRQKSLEKYVISFWVRNTTKLMWPEAVCLVRCLGRSQLVSSLSPLVNKLFGVNLSWAQTLIRSFTERQLSHKVHTYLVHSSCLTCSQGTKNTQKSSCPSRSELVSSLFITHSQMTKHKASVL